MFHFAFFRKFTGRVPAALGVYLTLSSTAAFAQTAGQHYVPSNQEMRGAISAASPSMHGPTAIDVSRLPADVLNCDVCRARLGLPPIAASKAAGVTQDPARISIAKPHPVKPSTPEQVVQPLTIPGPMLGSPGLIPASVADQMAQQGLVIAEFKPPEPEAGAINLDSIPREARQQFLKQLELPWGARVMSANIKDGQASGAESTELRQAEDGASATPIPPPNPSLDTRALSGDERLPAPQASSIIPPTPQPPLANLPPQTELPPKTVLPPAANGSRLDPLKEGTDPLKSSGQITLDPVDTKRDESLKQLDAAMERLRLLEAANAENVKRLEAATVELERVKAESASMRAIIEAYEKTSKPAESKGQEKAEPKTDKKKGKPPRGNRPFVNGEDASE